MDELESSFQSKVIKDLMRKYPGAFILKIDPNYLQGFPDRLMLFEDRWATFEIKRHFDSPRQANQEYYINILNQMSYASFLYPENKDQVFHELQQTFRLKRRTRLFGG